MKNVRVFRANGGAEKAGQENQTVCGAIREGLPRLTFTKGRVLYVLCLEVVGRLNSKTEVLQSETILEKNEV